LQDIKQIEVPKRLLNSTHVFHQYTIKVKNGKRDVLKKHLENLGIPAMIYYPIPLNEQEAYINIGHVSGELTNTNYLCKSVLSLPMHTELIEAEQIHISQAIHSFFNT
jgi:dTDP-4-amino-4,6-dideoxygalactose transaminase